jgi:hypothetical protein
MIKQVVDAHNRKNKKAHLVAMNFGEFCDVMDTYKPSKDKSSNKSYDKSFHGDKEFGESLNASKKLLWKGYEPQEMKTAFAGFETEFKAKQEIIAMDIEGHDFDVAAIMSGDEDQWFKTAEVGNAPSIHIVYNGNAHWAIDPMNFYIQSAVINKLAELLELESRIKVSASYQMQNALKHDPIADDLAFFLSVKDYDEPSNAKRLGGVSHPSFFRRNVFAMMENPNGEFYTNKSVTNEYGYGYNGQDLVSEELMGQTFGADYTLRIPSPESSHFENVDNAVAYCKDMLKKVQTDLSLLK